jgi:hypothetical protein
MFGGVVGTGAGGGDGDVEVEVATLLGAFAPPVELPEELEHPTRATVPRMLPAPRAINTLSRNSRRFKYQPSVVC